MLKPIKSKTARASGGSFVIVASQYNARFVDAMVRAAKAEFVRAKANVRIVRVPGAFEIPFAPIVSTVEPTSVTCRVSS